MSTPAALKENAMGSRRKPLFDTCRFADMYGMTNQSSMSTEKGAGLIAASRYKSPARYKSKLIIGANAAIGRRGHSLRRVLKYANLTISETVSVPCTSILTFGAALG